MSIKKLAQVCLEDKYSRRKIRQLIKNEIIKSIPTHQTKFNRGISAISSYLGAEYYPSKNNRLNQLKNAFCEPEQIMLEVLMAALPADDKTPIQAIAHALGVALGFDNELDAVKTASELLIIACVSDFYDVNPAVGETSISISSKYSLSNETLRRISVTKYLPPMVCRPKKISSNFHCAYITQPGHIILGRVNQGVQKQALDVINILNQISLSLDTCVLEYAEEPKEGLDATQLKEFNKMANQSTVIYQEMLDHGNKFYLTWKYDSRGRSYSQGYHINLQSSEYKKALINLTDEVVITQ